jgi:hypothetical protein
MILAFKPASVTPDSSAIVICRLPRGRSESM